MKQFYLINKESEITELTGLDREGIWDAGIDLDDWDYFVFIPTTDKFIDSGGRMFNYAIISPKEEIWDRLLSGCAGNVWIHIKTPKGNFYVGGAYHS